MTIRAAVKRRLVEVFDAELDDITVTYSYPRTEDTNNRLWFGDCEGRFDPESIGYTNPLTVDIWTLNVEAWMFGYTDPADAEEALEEQVRAVDELLRSMRRLHLNGDGGAGAADFAGVRTVRLGQVFGPFHTYPNPNSGSTIAGTVGFQLDCTADL